MVSLLPLLAALAAGVSARILQRALRPDVAARVLTLVAVGSALAVVWEAATLGVGFLVEASWLTGWVGWCVDVYRFDDRVPPALGVAGLAVVTTALARAALVCIPLRGAVGLSPVHGPLEIVDTEEPIAFAVPGSPGTIVVSTGMLDRLDGDERRVLFAHERSHLEHRHDRYLLAAEMAAGAIPLLRAVAAQVRFSTERWADEDAAGVVGNRRLVGQAIARAALATVDHRQHAMALGGCGVPARVQAMHAPPRAGLLAPALGATLAVGVVVADFAGSTMQLHHLVTFFAHICTLS